MSRISTVHSKTGNVDFHIERFESAAEVVEKNRTRQITNSSFDNMSEKDIRSKWHGVGSYDEALELMRTGYQAATDSFRGVMINRSGEGTRYTFKNQIEGFAPVVPLALMNVPNCMVNMQMKPIKSKVVDVYYDIVAGCGKSNEEILEAGKTLLSAVVDLEKQGYRFNLYAVQTYKDGGSADMLVVKVKSATQPLDLKRASFPLAHTAFFRVIGFDWYSKVPGGKYRFGYGHALAYDISGKRLEQVAKELFGNNAIYLSAAMSINDKNHMKEVLTNGSSKN